MQRLCYKIHVQIHATTKSIANIVQTWLYHKLFQKKMEGRNKFMV